MSRTYFELRCAKCHTIQCVSTSHLELPDGVKTFECAHCRFENTLTNQSQFQVITRAERDSRIRKITAKRTSVVPSLPGPTPPAPTPPAMVTPLRNRPVAPPPDVQPRVSSLSRDTLRKSADHSSDVSSPSIPRGPQIKVWMLLPYVALLIGVAFFLVRAIHQWFHQSGHGVEATAATVEFMGVSLLACECALNCFRETIQLVLDSIERIICIFTDREFRPAPHHDFAKQLRSISIPVGVVVIGSVIAIGMFFKNSGEGHLEESSLFPQNQFLRYSFAESH